MFSNQHTEEVELHDLLLKEKDLHLFVKREDQLDPIISGNKFRKLKYNLQAALESGHHTILTFGGAYSNHIHAIAYGGKQFGFKTIGIIRGEPTEPINPTLKDALAFGMELRYINREVYRHKSEPDFLANLKNQYGDFFLVPEGGSNVLAVKGCEELISDIEHDFDFICCACGTGGTLAGIICGLRGETKALGFPVLKGGEFLKKEISDLALSYSKKNYSNWRLITDFHFGGYAKFDWGLISFINDFKAKHDIPLDPVYTGKMMYGIFDLIKNDFFPPGSRIMAIHTGGLQGIRGFNERFGELIK